MANLLLLSYLAIVMSAYRPVFATLHRNTRQVASPSTAAGTSTNAPTNGETAPSPAPTYVPSLRPTVSPTSGTSVNTTLAPTSVSDIIPPCMAVSCNTSLDCTACSPTNASHFAYCNIEANGGEHGYHCTECVACEFDGGEASEGACGLPNVCNGKIVVLVNQS